MSPYRRVTPPSPPWVLELASHHEIDMAQVRSTNEKYPEQTITFELADGNEITLPLPDAQRFKPEDFFPQWEPDE